MQRRSSLQGFRCVFVGLTCSELLRSSAKVNAVRSCSVSVVPRLLGLFTEMPEIGNMQLESSATLYQDRDIRVAVQLKLLNLYCGSLWSGLLRAGSVARWSLETRLQVWAAAGSFVGSISAAGNTRGR